MNHFNYQTTAMDLNEESAPSGVLFEEDVAEQEAKMANGGPKKGKKLEEPYRLEIVWFNVLWFVLLHTGALYGVYLIFASAKIYTTLYGFLLCELSLLSITAGVHRLWAHRAYKAKWPLRLTLMILNLLAYQNSIYEWARDHRVHHKFSETNADPVNAKRGFFFSHVGWLLCRKHPEVRAKGGRIDLSDLERDPIVMFQKRHYYKLVPFASFVIPTLIPMYFWGETLSNSWYVATMFRYCLSLNLTWLVNSAAHMWGNKPYDKNINPVENLAVAIGSLGEGWHNFHHVFPWDYKTSELGNYSLNFTNAFIDLAVLLGLAYDLKTVPVSMIKTRVGRTGDGSHDVWGWGDKDLPKELADQTMIENRKTE
ncbi:hypothetical protein R5R35_004335 [Gryllus longicercus]|uniref:Desaturase n=1 Tax=Gryllus longicercus TaxID=2509291 RepID=A0AAN9VIC2_9ORTH